MTKPLVDRLCPRRESAFAFLAWLCLGPGACTKFASEWDLSEEDVERGLLAADPSWACVPDSAEPSPVMGPNPLPLDYSVFVVDFITGMTPRNLRVRACYRGDIDCVRPATDQLAPDENGIVVLPLSVGFNGFLELTGDDVVPSILVFPDSLFPELIAQLEPIPVALLTYQALLAFGESSQTMLDPQSGVISMNVFDCIGPDAANVRLELNVPALPFAFVDGLPIAFLDTTTEDGTVGFANVLPGLVVVRAFRTETAELVGLETVLVRRGWLTFGNMMPQFARPP